MRHSGRIALLLLVWPALAAGQQLPQEPLIPGDLFIRYGLEVEARTEAGGLLRATRVPSPATYVVDSIRALGGMRRIFTRSLHVTADVRGLATNALALQPVPSLRDTAALVRLQRSGLILPVEAGVSFPEQALATAFRVLPAGLRAGQRLTDTLSWRGERFGVRAAEQGIRVSFVLRDTVVAGRALWLVRDSTRLVREAAWLSSSVGSAEGMTYAWRAAGVRTGNWLWDPQDAVARSRTDTVRLEGELVRSEGGGRQLSTRRRVTQVETWAVYSGPEYQLLRAAQLAESRRTMGGMVPYPGTPLQQRLVDGDTAALDSLVAVWRGSGAETRAAIELQLAYWWRRNPEVRYRRLHAAALEVGDTVAAFNQATSVLGGYSKALPAAEFRFVLPWLEDAARAFRSGLNVEAVFDRVLEALMLHPRVLSADSSSPCGEGVCALLEHYRDRTDVDSRLADLGLVAAFYRDPRAHFASLEARAAVGTSLLRRVHRQALGYPFEWNDPGRGGPVPPVGSDWRTWAAWAGGRVSEHTSFEVLRLYRARTGRDFASEFRTAYQRAQTDSARYTFGMLLGGMQPAAFGEAEVIALLDSGSDQLVALGRSALGRILLQAAPAPAEVAEPMLDALIGMFFLGEAPPWAGAGERPRASAAARSGMVLIADSLPAPVRARWQARVTINSAAEWQQRDPRAAAVSFRPEVKQSGAFLVLTYGTSQHMAVPPDAAPRHAASGGRIVLQRTGSGWKQVMHTAWTT